MCILSCLKNDLNSPLLNEINQFFPSVKISFTLLVGRAGRVSAGTCFRMVTREFYESFLPEFGIPEMQVCRVMLLALW